MAEAKKELQIKVSDEVFKGTYANNVLISHTRGEFILDFMTIFYPQGQPQGVLGARIIITPSHAKRLAKAIIGNVAQYEKNFGEIAEDAAPEMNEISAH